MRRSTPLLRTRQGYRSGSLAVAIAPDGRLAVSGSDDRTPKPWDLQSGEVVATFPADQPVLRVAATVVLFDAGGNLHLLDPVEPLPSGEERA